MLAATYTRTGPAAEGLVVDHRPDPVPGPGEVLVRVHASGINPADVKRRAGWNGMQMEHPLVIPHTDGAGEIVEVGAGVDRARIGERVWLWNAQGGYGTAGRAFGTAAGLIAIDADQAVRLPDEFDFVAGACIGVPAMTAFRAVHADGPVEDQTILVNGAAGAVGHCAVQIAASGGARVIGTVGNEQAATHVMAGGAFATIDRRREDVFARRPRHTGRFRVQHGARRGGIEGQRHRRLLLVEQQSAAGAALLRLPVQGRQSTFHPGLRHSRGRAS